MSNAYQLSGIRFCYQDTVALSLPELSIRANKITALIGPNGCGKSTLLNLLSFLEKSQQGQIDFFGKSVTKQNTASFIKRVAFVAQKPYMLRGSVSENIVSPLKFHHIKQNFQSLIDTALEELNISHLSQQQAKQLSGGEQQKVALARAIVTNPDVLIMDEPFSYLDHDSQQLLEQFIHRYIQQNKKTLIFSTHNRLQGITIADDVISLVKGKSVKTALINLFQGSVNKQLFDTGKIKIMLADDLRNYQHVSIAPDEIVLSREIINSSMRNQFQGKVTAIIDENGKIRISVLAGELFQVLITPQALKELKISLGDQLWVNFKSNSILAF